MSIFHNSTRVNRLPEVRDRATAGLRSNRFQASIIEKWLCVVLCLVFVFSASGAAVPQAAHAAEEGYLFDRVITWADGSTEHVQIGRDNFFYLNGQKKHLVGMNFLPYNPSNTGHEWDISNATNQTFYAKQLAYLSSKGVRLIHLKLTCYGQLGAEAELAIYNALFALLSQYKMLVIFQIETRDITGFDAAMNAHTMASLPMWNEGETLNTFLLRILPIIANYTNIVAVKCENELDYTTGMTYDADDVTYHMTYLTGLVKNNTPFLTTHNLMGDFPTQEPAIKAAVLALIDIPTFDFYQKTPALILSACETNLPQLGITGNWWGLETGQNNRGNPDWDYDQNLVTAGFLDSAFKAGATVACMFLNIYTSDTSNYFDSNGNPKPNLTEIAREIPRLQAVISAPPVVATASLPIAPALSTPAQGTTSNKILSAR